MNPFSDFFRCPPQFSELLGTASGLPTDPGYFRFGDTVCYGRQSVGAGSLTPTGALIDVAPAVQGIGERVQLPFDLGEVIDNLRYERYPEAKRAADELSEFSLKHSAYYLVRPLLPVPIRRHLQRLHWNGWRDIAFPKWPVDTTVESLMRLAAGAVLERDGIREFPFVWFWPEGAPGCVMMTHDIEGVSGARYCTRLMEIDKQFGIRSAFQVVPNAPWSSSAATRELVESLKRAGFEVNVHDLAHDGQLFRKRERFLGHASSINSRGREFGSRGFRSGAMYRRQDWFADLDISYDMSVPNVAHLEPQRGGCCTVFPYFLGHVLELPLTAAQDYTVFNILGEYSTRLWQEQAWRVLAEHGLVSFIAHPDYLDDPQATTVYADLLRFIALLRTEQGIWVAPPGEIDRWWRQRHEMEVVNEGGSWRVKGPGSDRARLAWARIQDSQVVYSLNGARQAA